MIPKRSYTYKVAKLTKLQSLQSCKAYKVLTHMVFSKRLDK
jgi:hypothetical protein